MPDLLGLEAQAKAALQKASDSPASVSSGGSSRASSGAPSGTPSPAVERDVLNMTSRIVAAHVSNNAVESADLPSLIEQVYETLVAVAEPGTASPNGSLTPAVPIKNSITPDYIVCLEDGKKLKMLKRHLKTAYNLTPEEYRERWGLPADYPMVAPNYAKQRSRLAKQIGLGTKPAPR